MSGDLAPSKSTVYVSNLPFKLTNNDIHRIFERYGQVVKVTIMRDKDHRSKGVAFVLFLDRESAWKSVKALSNTEMFGRTIKVSIANDNGRAADYIRKKRYPDKSSCYECGDEGHLSYRCPHNLFGDRELPKDDDKKKKKKGKRKQEASGEYGSAEEDSDEGEDPKKESLAAAIEYERNLKQETKPSTSHLPLVPTQKMEDQTIGNYNYVPPPIEDDDDDDEPKRKHYKKDAYFSDEEELSD